MVGLVKYDNTSFLKKLTAVKPGEILDFRYSDLRMVDMVDQDIRGTFKAITRHARTAEPGDVIFIDFTKSNLSGRDFSNYDLTHVIFSKVIAHHAIFAGSNLTDTKIDEADVSYADMRNTSLNYTKMYNTTIDGVNFSYADFTNAYGLALRDPGKKTVKRLSVVASIAHSRLPKAAEPFRKMIEGEIENHALQRRSIKKIDAKK